MIRPECVQETGERYRDVRASAAARADQAPVDVLEKRRADRLNRTAAILTAKSLALEADTSPVTVRSQSEVIDSLAKERVIGSNDLKDIDYLEMAIAVSRSVGRIRLPGGYATGFLIGPRLMMTNHHVFENAAMAGRSAFQLDYQDDATGKPLPVHSYAVDPAFFFHTSIELDFSIAGVAEQSDQGRALSLYPWIKLIADLGKIAVGDSINIIQHPLGGLKQIAFRANEVIAMPSGKSQFLYYSTDTEPGSSGSPCFNDQWELVALHHQAVPDMDGAGKVLKQDGSPFQEGRDSPSLIKWIANEGARVSAILAYLKTATLTPAERDRLGSAVALAAPNPIELARAVPVPEPSPAPAPATSEAHPRPRAPAPEAKMGNSQTFTLPLQITVTLGPAEAVGVGVVQPQPAIEERSPADTVSATETVIVDQNYAGRPGYDTEFLGFEVPLPSLGADMKTDTAEVDPEFLTHDDPFELAYYHYSVYMNKRRRTAWFSAANVDGSKDSRPNIGKRSGDRWYADTRIPATAQLDQKAFEPGIDRGHLTRREDTAWGTDVADALRSNNDTFHFTNCSLQASPFNRGKDRWQGLEQFLLEKHAKPENRRLVVITGPLFADNDPVYRNDKMSYSVRCPLQFWKVCVLQKADGTPSATAFVLGQEDIKDLPGFEEEAFDVGAVQVTIDELEHRSGLNFGAARDHDHFAETKEPTLEALVSNRRFRRKPIRSGEDIAV